MEDAEIIELFEEREENAISEINISYGEKLYCVAFKILQNHEDAEESVNDTYMKAWNAIPPEKPVYLFAYLAKICRHCALGKLDWNLAKKRQANIVALTEELEHCIPDRSADITLEGEDIGRLLNCFVAGLPQDSRMIFVRRYWYADSIQEIAARCGFRESKVKTQLHRMRKKLRDDLEREGLHL